MFHIALYEPEIAPNTGNIIRLCANNGCHLHLIEPLGFDLSEKKLRRAGLDYKDLTKVTQYPDYKDFILKNQNKRVIACTTKANINHSSFVFATEDILLFGPESRGLPLDILTSIDLDKWIKIPMKTTARSLNLSNAVAIISYEAWRQIGYK